MSIVAVFPGYSDQYGIDHLYVHGAEISDPYNNLDVIWDESVQPPQPVFVITLEPAEDEEPYRAALAEHGLTVTGTDAEGNWTLQQARPL